MSEGYMERHLCSVWHCWKIKSAYTNLKESRDPFDPYLDPPLIIDLMAIVHKDSTRNVKTFEDLANNLSEQHIDEAYTYADHLIIVPDRYDVINSIKYFVRQRRSNETYAERIISTGKQPLPSNIHSFLSDG